MNHMLNVKSVLIASSQSIINLFAPITMLQSTFSHANMTGCCVSGKKTDLLDCLELINLHYYLV